MDTSKTRLSVPSRVAPVRWVPALSRGQNDGIVVLNTRNLLAPPWEWFGATPTPALYAFPTLSRVAFKFCMGKLK